MVIIKDMAIYMVKIIMVNILTAGTGILIRNMDIIVLKVRLRLRLRLRRRNIT